MSIKLPPLNALKAFEAAARCASFSLAAEELGVSPAAVSQLVRKFERHLDKSLFRRHNNRVVLTDAGQSAFAGITPALHEIAETVQRLSRSPTRRKLVISCIPSVAECWLVTALPDFVQQHPRLRIDLRVEEDVDQSQREVDIRIGYGRPAFSEMEHLELLQDEVLPLCSPGFIAARGGTIRFDAGLSNDLVHTSWGELYGSNPGWQDWYAAHAPGQRVDMAAGHRVDASRHALAFAREGLGIALAPRWLARMDLQAERLVAVSDKSLPLGDRHFLSCPLSKARTMDVVAFRAWALSRAQF